MSVSYKSFAYHYDEMMRDVDYTQWLKLVMKHVKRGSSVLDVGCGTGTLSFMMADAGYEVVGMDASADMLVVASEKNRAHESQTTFIEKDMRDVGELSGFDCVVIALDTLNYLETEKDVIKTFKGVYATLNTGGVLIFDVHPVEKIRDVFDDYLYVEQDDDLTYIWHVDHAAEPNSIIHELTLFAKNEDGTYSRYMEQHHQRTFEKETYISWLRDAGFEIVDEFGDEMRQFFIVKKG